MKKRIARKNNREIQRHILQVPSYNIQNYTNTTNGPIAVVNNSVFRCVFLHLLKYIHHIFKYRVLLLNVCYQMSFDHLELSLPSVLHWAVKTYDHQRIFWLMDGRR